MGVWSRLYSPKWRLRRKLYSPSIIKLHSIKSTLHEISRWDCKALNYERNDFVTCALWRPRNLTSEYWLALTPPNLQSFRLATLWLQPHLLVCSMRADDPAVTQHTQTLALVYLVLPLSYRNPNSKTAVLECWIEIGLSGVGGEGSELQFDELSRILKNHRQSKNVSVPAHVKNNREDRTGTGRKEWIIVCVWMDSSQSWPRSLETHTISITHNLSMVYELVLLSAGCGTAPLYSKIAPSTTLNLIQLLFDDQDVHHWSASLARAGNQCFRHLHKVSMLSMWVWAWASMSSIFCKQILYSNLIHWAFWAGLLA